MSVLPSASDPHPTRTHNCGELTAADNGVTVVLKGWVDTRRDLGGVIFIDLRDRYGFTQIVFSPQDNPEAYEKASNLRNEYVISISGVVEDRSKDTVNEKIKTGQIEVKVLDLAILNTSEALPFQVSVRDEKSTLANEDIRLKYRYLDMRREELQSNLVLRHKLYQATRSYFDKHDFIEVETPVLMKSTPEGARDYLVPSRVHPGKFYALPQSPQTYKQILMVAGMDRYFQIVKCFRDEDLRADRQPEFTQIDVELTFAREEIVYELVEGLIAKLWKDTRGIDIPIPFPRLTYREAIERFGSDKPDMRFGMELQDVTNECADSGFRLFDTAIADGGKVLAIVVKGEGERGRGAMDRLDKDVVRKRIGAGGLIYFKLPADGGDVNSSVKENVLPKEVVLSIVGKVKAEAGDLVLLLCGAVPKVYQQMGALRLNMASETGQIPPGAEGPWNFLWVTEFPLLEWDAGANRFFAMHHPFTSPHSDDFESMDDDPGAIRARAYDLVLNGVELGGGSIRIHSREVQAKMFELLGIDEAEAQQRFGFLLDAFRFGAPPHGGIALGLDRIAMLLTGAQSLRDVIAFPKTQRAQELMVQSPDAVDDSQLKDLHIRTVLPEA